MLIYFVYCSELTWVVLFGSNVDVCRDEAVQKTLETSRSFACFPNLEHLGSGIEKKTVEFWGLSCRVCSRLLANSISGRSRWAFTVVTSSKRESLSFEIEFPSAWTRFVVHTTLMKIVVAHMSGTTLKTFGLYESTFRHVMYAGLTVSTPGECIVCPEVSKLLPRFAPSTAGHVTEMDVVHAVESRHATP